MSFSPAFSPAFAGAGGAGAVVETGQPTLGLSIAIVSPLVFDSTAGYVKWTASATVGGEVLSQLTGEIRITAAEDAARVASFSVVPTTPVQLLAFESAPVTLDVTLFRTGETATYRRFTGVVETVEFDPASRVATLHCRDGYQERPKACQSAAEVESLFSGLAYPCAQVLPWNGDQPDPVGYFSGLQATLMGACAIDSSGVWQAVPWVIQSPSAAFHDGEIFSDSMRVSMANRRELPASIRGTLNFRFSRLHCAEKLLTWDDPGYSDHLVYGLPILGRATVIQALTGLNGWIIKGKPVIDIPIAGAHAVIVGGSTLYYVIPYDTAQTACEHLTVTLYRRWYQQVQLNFVVDIPMGGMSDREESVSATMTSSFDASRWESSPTTEDSLGLYLTNPPVVAVPPTGYEGLPSPFPPANAALDHHPDITAEDIGLAAQHVVALALRKAAAGKRKQTIQFERPLDPRWEIGAVLAVDAYGVTATGQLVAFEDRLDHDSGEAVSTLTLACPDGTGVATAFTASATAPVNTVAHALSMPALGTHKGGWVSTPAVPVEDELLGFLCNVIPSADAADPGAPSYIAQFRIIMPEIPADVRDPLTIEAPITASVDIAGSGLAVVF